jgi:hypothetical protein
MSSLRSDGGSAYFSASRMKLSVPVEYVAQPIAGELSIVRQLANELLGHIEVQAPLVVFEAHVHERSRRQVVTRRPSLAPFDRTTRLAISSMR